MIPHDQLANRHLLDKNPWATQTTTSGGNRAQIKSMEDLLTGFKADYGTNKKTINPDTGQIEDVIVFRSGKQRGPGTHLRIETQGDSADYLVPAKRIAYQEGKAVNGQVIVPIDTEMMASTLDKPLAQSMSIRKVVSLVDRTLVKRKADEEASDCKRSKAEDYLRSHRKR